MTPKEKAKDLCTIYSFYFGGESDIKKCALIAVNEMLEHVEMMDDGAAIKYWEEVKQEIENIKTKQHE